MPYLLNKEEIEKIHLTGLKILEEIGLKIDDAEIIKKLQALGANYENNRLKLPKDLTLKILNNVPKEIRLKGRNSKELLIKKNGLSYMHSTGGIPSFYNSESKTVNNATLSQFKTCMRLMDNLPEIDMPCSLIYPEDVPPQISQIKQLEHMMKYLNKPIYGPGISTPLEAKYVAKLFKVYNKHYGSPETSTGVVGLSPQSPLYYPKEITKTMEKIITAQIPTVILTAPVAGISAPLPLAGGLAQLHAEVLSFIVIGYIFNPKTPYIYGARLNFPNMKNGISIWGLPETGLASAIAVQLAAHCGLAADVYGVCCSSCSFDSQNGYEKAINSLLPFMAGASLISGAGSMGSLMMSSYEQLVIDNEIMAILRRLKKGIEVSEDTLSFELMEKVINKNESFLNQAHTVKHLRKGEFYRQNLGLDNSFAHWLDSGQPNIEKFAQEKVNKILQEDKFEDIPQDLNSEINEIIKQAELEIKELI